MIATVLAVGVSGCLLDNGEAGDHESEGTVQTVAEPTPAPHSFETKNVDFTPAAEDKDQAGKADNAYKRDDGVPVDYSSKHGNNQGSVPSQEQCDDADREVPDSECSETGDDGIGHGSPQPLDPTRENEPEDDDESDDE